MSRSSRVCSVTPSFVVSDIQSSVRFYTMKLGYSGEIVYGDPPCFAMMYRDGFELMLTLAGEAKVSPNGPSGVWDMYVSVADVAGELAALEAAGVAIDRGPTDTFYKMREIEIVDPDGYRVCLAQDISG